MRALVLDSQASPARVRLRRDHPEPEPGPGEALVHLRLAGVCATDLELVRGYAGFSGVLGHEFVGRVDADDDELGGRRVVADINLGCGRCEDCRLGDGHHCATRQVLGIRGHDGAFAERLVVPRDRLRTVPEALDDELAVFAEPLAAGLHVLDEIDARDEQVTVLGDGKLGLLTALALRGAGLAVRVVGHHEAKLALAAAAGAETALEPELGPGDRRSAALVVEATGSAGGLSRALELARPRATVVLKSTVARPLAVDFSPVVVHELRLIGSRCGDMSQALELLAAGRVDPRPLIAARYELDAGERALARAAEPGVLKVLIRGPG